MRLSVLHVRVLFVVCRVQSELRTLPYLIQGELRYCLERLLRLFVFLIGKSSLKQVLRLSIVVCLALDLLAPIALHPTIEVVVLAL